MAADVHAVALESRPDGAATAAAPTRERRRRVLLPGALLGLALGIGVADVVVGVAVNHSSDAGSAFGLLFITGALGVGFVVARHQPANPIGWLLVGSPTLVLTFLLLQELAQSTDRSHPTFAYWMDGLVQVFYFAFLFSAPLILLFFPDGTLPSARWRWVLVAYGAMGVTVIVLAVAWAAATAHGPHRFTSTGGLAGAGPPGFFAVPLVGLLVGCFALAIAWVVRRIVGYRRSTGAVRQQYKWLGAGAVCLLAALVISFVTPSGHTTTATVENLATAILTVPFPLAVGIAILRYRLYDIDRIVSRSVSYVVVTALVVGVYVGVVSLCERAFSFSSPLAVAASTLAAAAAFAPLRRGVQRRIDRRFNRSRYDAEAAIAAFATHLRETVDAGRVADDLLAVVQTTVEPSASSVWLARTSIALPGDGAAVSGARPAPG